MNIRLFSESKHLFRQMVLYGIIGLSCAGTDTLIFYLLTSSGMLTPLPANCTSSLIGICLSFFLNAHFNFKVHDHLIRRGTRFFTVGLTGLAMSSGILAWSEARNYPVLLSKVCAVLIVAIFQFIMNKLISFRKQT